MSVNEVMNGQHHSKNQQSLGVPRVDLTTNKWKSKTLMTWTPNLLKNKLSDNENYLIKLDNRSIIHLNLQHLTLYLRLSCKRQGKRQKMIVNRASPFQWTKLSQFTRFFFLTLVLCKMQLFYPRPSSQDSEDSLWAFILTRTNILSQQKRSKRRLGFSHKFN